MLRPKKKITKKEIQRDPFLETVDQAQAHLEENRSRYLQIGIVILAILIGINVLSNNSQNANKEASSSLGDALLTLDLNDQTTAKFQFETVINEYENTTSASLAEYYLGKMSYDNNDNVNAEKYLSSYLNNNPKGLILESPFTSIVDMGKRKFPFLPVQLILKDKYDNLKKISFIKCPVLYLHGKSDNLVPKYMSDILIERTQTRAESYFPENDKHMMNFDKKLMDNIDKFIKNL